MIPCSPHAPTLAALALLALSATACRSGDGGSETPAPVRLADLAASGELEIAGTHARPEPHPIEWTFASEPAGLARGPGLARLEVRDGRLAGESSNDFPVLSLAVGDGAPVGDVLHAVEIRMQVSAGTTVSVSFSAAEAPDLEQAAAQGAMVPWRVASPLLPGPEPFTYTLDASRNPFPVPAEGIRYLLVRPTDAAGASFEIESVRLVFRRDHLARIESGLSWQGLGEIYHETLVTRSPEVVRARLTVPERPRLLLSVGTVETEPVTFTVGVAPADDPDAVVTTLVRRVVDEPERWQPLDVDLGDRAGEEVVLTLATDADDDGRLGFWGSPVVFSGWPARAAADAPPRGVILILADTLRRDHLGLYGYERETDPELARFAAEGTTFRDCLVEATWTKASAPSIFTSLHPLSHGVLDFDHRLPSAAETIGERYRSAGRSTLLLSSIIFTGRFSNLHQGFEEVHESASLADRRSSKTAGELVDRLIPWIDRHRDVPYFAVLHVLDPHDPYRPPPPDDTRWADPEAAERHPERAAAVREQISDPLLQAFGMPSRDEVAAAGFDPDEYIQVDVDWYDGSIHGMDAALGRLFEHLRTTGRADSTLVAFTADHGEEFFDHGRTFHGQGVHAELTDVPLIFWGPGRVPAGRTVKETVQAIDVMPTLLALSGAPVPEAAQGRSLVPLWSGERRRSEPPPAFVTRAATDDFFGPPPREKEAYAVVRGRWKLVHNVHRVGDDPEVELYDRRDDPRELRDVAADHPDVVADLLGLLGRWRHRVEGQRLPSDAETESSISGDELERLRSLGYVQ